ncbi:hypothetical protein pdam_00015619 [Pocillopora damicornis]|uniref:Phosphatidylinositol N-acetylglucosaminyltransferase subunit C n=1 Tax=Pocillopora damicornis TaxID=46731 RepID=A0A3M6TWS1_POCDA|nr:hypothetical protein pdam_00015619 [Pocillopora damicornis]
MQCALFLQTMINDSGKDNDFLPVQMKRRKPWRKVLYEDQGVPDNYVDKSFLDEMRKNRMDDIRICVVVLCSVYVLSPVLKTLTDTISTDTIYAMTTFMLGMNLLLYDYGTHAAIVSRSASLNASIFASVCLASRLPSSWHVFGTVTFAMQLFALFPSLRRQLKMQLPSSHVVLTWTLVLIAVAMLWPLSQLFALLLALVHLAVTFLCPFWLIKLQRFKNNIHGPWDEAVIEEELEAKQK